LKAQLTRLNVLTCLDYFQNYITNNVIAFATSRSDKSIKFRQIRPSLGPIDVCQDTKTPVFEGWPLDCDRGLLSEAEGDIGDGIVPDEV
jgi:hypothetical protein